MQVSTTPYVDKLVAYHTAFNNMADMLDTHESYRPSINCRRNDNAKERVELEVIADAYDYNQELRKDTRRAFRY